MGCPFKENFTSGDKRGKLKGQRNSLEEDKKASWGAAAVTRLRDDGGRGSAGGGWTGAERASSTHLAEVVKNNIVVGWTRKKREESKEGEALTPPVKKNSAVSGATLGFCPFMEVGWAGGEGMAVGK